jgi:hypothetical protein
MKMERHAADRRAKNRKAICRNGFKADSGVKLINGKEVKS